MRSSAGSRSARVRYYRADSNITVRQAGAIFGMNTETARWAMLIGEIPWCWDEEHDEVRVPVLDLWLYLRGSQVHLRPQLDLDVFWTAEMLDPDVLSGVLSGARPEQVGEVLS